MLRSQVNGKLAVDAEMEFAAFTVNTAMFIFKTSRAYIRLFKSIMAFVLIIALMNIATIRQPLLFITILHWI